MMPDQDGLSERGLAALEYAQQGFWCFPVHTPVPGGGCSCRNRECSNPGKHPRTKNGLSDASIDPDRIERWWQLWPEANIGISCGPSGLVVVDVDPRHGGDESWRDLTQALGNDIEDTRIGATGGGGTHYVFRCPINETVNSWASTERFTGPLGPGVDLRASGGYIVAPPSVHASGAIYQWEDDREPVVLPYKLLERIHGPRGNNAPIKLDNTADILNGVPQGERDWTLYRFACRLRAVDVPIDWAYELVGAAAAKCTPPFPLADARKKVESAYRRKPGVGGFEDPEAEPKHEGGLRGRVDLGAIMALGIPDPVWVIDDVVPAGTVIVIYGEPGCGKTIIDLSWHAQLAAEGKNSVFIDEESGISMMGRRLASMQADQAAITQYMHYYPFPGLTVADADALVAYCAEHKPALVTFDSLADMLSVSGLDENSAADVTRWMVSVAVRITQETGAAVVLIDHNAKDVTNVRYSRGSGAKKAKADGAWYVEKTSEFDEKTMGKVVFKRTKNRVGYLPESVYYSAGGHEGKLVVERSEGRQAGPIAVEPNVARVLEMLDACGEAGASSPDIEKHLGLKPWAWKTLRVDLVQAGWIKKQGDTRGTVNLITESGRAVFMGIQGIGGFGDSERDSNFSESRKDDFSEERGGETPRRGVSPKPPNNHRDAEKRKPAKRDWWSFDTDEED